MPSAVRDGAMHEPAPAAGRPARAPERRERYGIVWTDEYAWLRDPGYPEVRDPAIRSYLEAENVYFEAMMVPHRPLVEQLHAELKGRIKEDDQSVPAPWGAFAYQWRFEPGAQYRVWFRERLEGGEPEVVLDENELARDKSYFRLASFEPTHDGRLLAYASDEDGSERFRVHVTEIGAALPLPDLVTNCSGSVEWAEDGLSFLYVELNEQLRPFRVRLHRLGGDPAADPVLYEEADPAFFVSIGKTQSRRFLVVATGTHVTRELRVLDAADPSGPLRLVAARRTDHRYSLDHANGRFFILTNDRHENFRLVTAPESNPAQSEWEEVIAPSDRHYLLGLTCFADFMAIVERADGLSHVRIRTYAGEEHTVPFDRAGLHGGAGREPRVRDRPSAPQLHLDGHPGLRLRLRGRDPRADLAQAAGDPQRLRRRALHQPPPPGPGLGRDRGADHHRPPQGHRSPKAAGRCCSMATAPTGTGSTRLSPRAA